MQYDATASSAPGRDGRTVWTWPARRVFAVHAPIFSVPPLNGWNVIHGTTEAATGWEELCRVALPSAHRCLEALRSDPLSRDN